MNATCCKHPLPLSALLVAMNRRGEEVRGAKKEEMSHKSEQFEINEWELRKLRKKLKQIITPGKRKGHTKKYISKVQNHWILLNVYKNIMM